MAIYAIGDIQGAYDELQALLEKIGFDAAEDRLWLVGDLVNRGPRSADVLRFVRGLGDRAVAVLGNHDLHLLAVAAGTRPPSSHDTFDDVLSAPDRDELVSWLRFRPLMHHDPELGYVLVHAGLAPSWDLDAARRCAADVEAELRSDGYVAFLREMYGSKPDRWSDELTGMERLRFTLNCFTRLRLCDASGRLHLKEKDSPFNRADGLIPWFDVPGRASGELQIVFGHWSTLGCYRKPGVFALDSGCVWGGALTALRLDGPRPQWSDIACRGYCRPGED